MVILGVGSPFVHDPSAAIIVDGKLIAAADEERFIRKKHAKGELPVNAIKFCLKAAGLSPEDVDIVAYPWSFRAYLAKLFSYVARCWRKRPSRAFKAVAQASRRYNERTKKLYSALKKSGIDPKKVKIRFVEHHLAHAASAYHFSGFENAAIMTMDGTGEFTATMFAEGRGGTIKKIKEIIRPDSLGRFYSTVTAYLGFQTTNGEYKVMGMAPYGDPGKIDYSHIIKYNKRHYHANDDYVWVIRSKRFDKAKVFSKYMVKDWGPPRNGDGLNKPYVDIAAGAQKTLEDVTLALMETFLGKTLKENGGRLCFAGGCALNVSLNRKLTAHPLVKELFVQPASHDAGAALGAAVYTAGIEGEKIGPMKHVYYGPSYTDEEIKALLDKYKIPYAHHDDINEPASRLLAEGKILAWFQGAMEYGPRALGNRSILAHPSMPGISDEINMRIKFREKWRPFCPSLLPEYARDILDSTHEAPYMTIGFKVKPHWKEKIKEAVHVDGTVRPQVVDPETNPKFYSLLKRFHEKTKTPVLINTSLNRRGEPMVCSPQDALDMFYGSGLEYMVLGDYLVKK